MVPVLQSHFARFSSVDDDNSGVRVMSSNGIAQSIVQPSDRIDWSADPSKLANNWMALETSGLLWSVPGSIPVAMNVFGQVAGGDIMSEYLRRACREFRCTLWDIPLSGELSERALRQAPRVAVHFRVLYFPSRRERDGSAHETHPDLVKREAAMTGLETELRPLQPRVDDFHEYKSCVPTIDICWRGRIIVRIG